MHSDPIIADRFRDTDGLDFVERCENDGLSLHVDERRDAVYESNSAILRQRLMNSDGLRVTFMPCR